MFVPTVYDGYYAHFPNNSFTHWTVIMDLEGKWPHSQIQRWPWLFSPKHDITFLLVIVIDSYKSDLNQLVYGISDWFKKRLGIWEKRVLTLLKTFSFPLDIIVWGFDSWNPFQLLCSDVGSQPENKAIPERRNQRERASEQLDGASHAGRLTRDFQLCESVCLVID